MGRIIVTAALVIAKVIRLPNTGMGGQIPEPIYDCLMLKDNFLVNINSDRTLTP